MSYFEFMSYFISTFKFESQIFSLKKLVRSPNLRLTQVANRIEELCNAPKLNENLPQFDVSVRLLDSESESYRDMKCFGLKFSIEGEADCWVLSKQGEVLKIVSLKRSENDTVIIETKRVKKLCSLYDIVDSRRFNIFKIRKEFEDIQLQISLYDVD